MRILFYLTRYPGIGGIESVTNIIISHLQKNNDIFIISHLHDEKVRPLEGVQLFFMPNDKVWCSKKNIQYAKDIMDIYRFNAIVYQDSYAPTSSIVCLLAKTYNVPLYVFEHNSPLFVYNKRSLDSITTIKGFLRRFFHIYILHQEIRRKKKLLAHAEKYVLLSKQFITEFCSLINVPIYDKRITYINNPALPVEVKFDIKKENVILCVSRLAREKCIDKMLDIWKNLSDNLSDWKFVIVGDGSERTKLEFMVCNNKIPRVEFVGFTDPNFYYQKAKIFWMTSKYEGWGMTLIEAMQRGCVPVVFHTFSSVNDIIHSGYNGFLIRPFDMNDFQSKTLELANNERMRICMAENSIQSVQKFSVDKIIYQWEKLLGLG